MFPSLYRKLFKFNDNIYPLILKKNIFIELKKSSHHNYSIKLKYMFLYRKLSIRHSKFTIFFTEHSPLQSYRENNYFDLLPMTYQRVTKYTTSLYHRPMN